jgi:peptidoglycan/xylan/chitin deacetylase (PgdA/CDA1 family)
MQVNKLLSPVLLFLLVGGNILYAEGGKRHNDPFRAISSNPHHNTESTTTTRKKRTPGRHFSPLDALNGRMIVKEKPEASSGDVHRRQHSSSRQQEVETKQVIHLDVKPSSDTTNVNDALSELNPMEHNNQEDGFQSVSGMNLPTKSQEKQKKTLKQQLPAADKSKKATTLITVTEPNSELPTGPQLKALMQVPEAEDASPAQNASQAVYRHAPVEKILYLTFDDGPINGTANVLRIIREENVEATMFYIGREVVNNHALFEQALAMPNVLVANHTYTHANNHYRRFYNGSVPSVLGDIDKAQAVIGGAKFLRLCGRNVWRLPFVQRDDWGISVAQRGREIGKYNALHTHGYFIYGWDVEWLFSHKTQKPIFSGEEMARRVNLKYQGRHSAKPGNVVLLAHDFMFRTTYNASQLRTFIRIMKAQGWKFKTIDAYSSTTPDAYVMQVKKTNPDKFKSAQKLARQATVMVPPNKPEVAVQHRQQHQSVRRVDLATQLSQAIRQQSFLQIRRLLAKGAKINSKDPKGDIPLNLAIQTNNAVLVRMLVERGAHIFNMDANGMSPMGVARQHNNTIIIRYLTQQIAKQKERRLHQTLFASSE